MRPRSIWLRPEQASPQAPSWLPQPLRLESAHRLEATGQLDHGLVAAVHRWAVGRSLDAVLRGSEIAAGDFVRWCKQVIDVLDQVATAAPTPGVRRTAHQAIEKLRRGVVAYSSV